MKTDYHCHVLPRIDDGAKTPEISLKMLEMMKSQDIENIVLTPHFYPHKEKSVDEFLQKRTAAFEKIKDQDFNFYLGAEVAVERGLSEIPDAEKLTVERTNLILLELPFSGFDRWTLDEIHNLVCETNVKPIFAHIHRYIELLSKSEIEEILNFNAVFQVNAEAFETFHGRAFVKKLLKSGKEVVFGSDAHNIIDRKPKYRRIMKCVKDEYLWKSDEILEKYRKL